MLLILLRGGGGSITGSQLLMIYTIIGFIIGMFSASFFKNKFSQVRYIIILLGILLAILSCSFIHTPTALGIAYGYPFGIAMYVILSIGDSKEK